MKVTINAAGRVVEIDSTEDDMNVHRLANIAINTWKRTEPGEPEKLGPAYGCDTQRDSSRWGFSWGMGRGEQPDVSAMVGQSPPGGTWNVPESGE